MRRVRARIGDRHLVRAERALDRDAVELLRPRPALRRPQHDHRPRPARVVVLLARGPLDRMDAADRVVERARHLLMHDGGVGAGDDVGIVAVAFEELEQLALGNARQHGRVRDLVAVQMQDRQHRAVVHRVEELVRMPARRQRSGLRLTVADDAADEEARIVERSAVGVRQRVAELAALVDRARDLGRTVTADAAGKRELAEERAQAVGVLRDLRIDLAVGALEVRVRDRRRAAVTGTDHHERVQVVDADQVQPRRRAPMAEKPRLDVLGPERLAQERIVEQVDLTDREVVGRAPVGVDRIELGVRQRLVGGVVPSRRGGVHRRPSFGLEAGRSRREAPWCRPSEPQLATATRRLHLQSYLTRGELARRCRLCHTGAEATRVLHRRARAHHPAP